MTETSKMIPIRVLAVLALAAAACSVDAGNQIPCVEDLSCPNDYPVCVSGKCTAGTSTAKASVAVVGAEGHTATDFLSGTVRVIVSARASSGVKTVALAFGTTSFTASTPAATPPLYAFDVNTTTLTDGDRQLTATLTAGDATTATANGTLHVDNANPVITSFTVAGGTSTTITAGTTTVISASFTGTSATATISDGSGGSVGIATGDSLLVSPDVLTSYSLRVTSRSGVSVQSGTTGQPSNVSVAVVGPASFTGNASVSPSSIQQGQNGSFTFTAPTFGSGMTAVVKDAAGATKGSTTTSGGQITVTIPTTDSSTTELDYTVVISNAATVPDSVSIPLVVHVGVPPNIMTFGTSTTITSGSSATLQATFVGGNGVITPGNIPITSGGTVVVAPTALTTYTLTVTNPTTSVSVSTGSGGQPANVTVTVVASPVITEFVSSTVHVTSGDAIPLSVKTTGVTGNASVTVACTQGSIAGFTIALTSGNGSSNPNPTAPTVTSTSTCTFTATVQNAATTSVSSRVVVTVEPQPSITTNSFVFAVSGTNAAFFARGDTVILNHTYNAHGGTATINGTPAGATSTTFPDIQFDTVYTLTVTNLAGATATATATATIAPGSWFLLNQNNAEARQGVTVTALDNGKVLIVGGASAAGTPSATAVLCDANGSCTPPPDTLTMNFPRAFHTAVKIPSGAPNNGVKVLLAGGYTAANLTTPTVTAEFYDPATNTFSTTTDITTGTVTAARARHIAVLLDSSHVLIAGGTNGTTDLSTASNYDAGTAATPTVANVGSSMAQARSNFTGTLLGTGNVLIVGGVTGNDTAELFNPSGSGSFSNTGRVSTTSTVEDKRGHTAMLVGGVNAGWVFVSGGVTGSGNGTASATQFLFKPGTATFTATANLRAARSSHAAIGLSNFNILLCGGTDGTSTLASCERYDPDLGSQRPTASMLERRKNFGLAPLTSTVLEQLASGGTDASSTTTAETYNAN